MIDLGRAGRLARGLGSVARRASPFPETRFLLLTPGRAGSTLLMTLLAAAPRVRCDDEVLREAVGDPTALLRRAAARAALGGVATWGTAVHPEHLLGLNTDERIRWAARLHDSGYELVTLVRRNHLAIAVSSVIAERRGVWHVVRGEEPSMDRMARVHIDPLHLLRVAITVERSTEEVRRMADDRSHLALVYEDDLLEAEAHQVTADRVLRFLGRPTAPVSSPLRRRTQPLLEQIDNLDELGAVLDHTRFGPMLPLVDG